MDASVRNNFNTNDQFRVFATSAVRNLLVLRQCAQEDVTYFLDKLEETVQTCHPTEDIGFYVDCLKGAIEHKWHWQFDEDKCINVIKVATLLLHFQTRKHAYETLALLTTIRFKGCDAHYDKHFTKAINELTSDSSLDLSYSALQNAIQRAKTFYADQKATFLRKSRKQRDRVGAHTYALIWAKEFAEQKAREDRSYSKCPSLDCSLRKLLNRYIAILQEQVTIVAIGKGKLPNELRDMVIGWTLIAECISARQVKVGEFKVETCQCL